MYLKHFNLIEHPFQLSPDFRYLYLSKVHARAKSYMDFSVWNRDSFIVITGEIGSGKTTLIEKLISELTDDVCLARIYQTQLSEVEFLQAVLVEFGLNPFSAEKVELISMLNSYLVEQYHDNKKVVLIVDEAQNLSKRVLEEIRLLTGLETENKNMLNVILVGQPELSAKLNEPDMEQLAQRIRLRFHIKALSKDEIQLYIKHRLDIAGNDNSELFSETVIPLIYKYTGGIPRLINTLCDTSLICAYSEDLTCIDDAVVSMSLEELQWQPYKNRIKEKINNNAESEQSEMPKKSNTLSSKRERNKSKKKATKSAKDSRKNDIKSTESSLETKVTILAQDILELKSQLADLKRDLIEKN